MKLLPALCLSLLPAIACSQSGLQRPHSIKATQTLYRLTDTSGFSIHFDLYCRKLNPKAKSILRRVALRFDTATHVKIMVMGGAGNSSGLQQLGWEQVNNTIEYLLRFPRFRRAQFIFQYDSNETRLHAVKLRLAKPGETGDSVVPPPHPQIGRDWIYND